MIKQGMNLTKEQRGEVKKESKMDSSSAAVEFSDEKKSAQENDDSIKVCGMIWCSCVFWSGIHGFYSFFFSCAC